MTEELRHLAELLGDFETCMFTTRTSFGQLTSRPMKLQKPRADRALWLVSSADTSSVENINHSSHVNLAFRRPSDQAWVSIAATAELNRDEKLLDELWDDSWAIWLRGDRRQVQKQVVLIDLEPFQIDFWEPEKGKLGTLFQLAKAQMTDSVPDLSPVRTLHINDAALAPAMKRDH